MKKVIFLLTVLGLILSCSINKRVETITLNQDNQCVAMLDSLSKLVEHIKFGVYSVDLNAVPVDKYKGLSELDLAKRGVPMSEEQQRIYEFEKFLYRVFKSEICSSLTSDMLVKKIGTPYEIGLDGSYTYLLNIGKDCPNCEHPINRIFSECSYFRIYWGQDRYKQNNISLFYTGL
jgi:hypothetical protein